MKFRSLIIVTAIILLPIAGSAATLVVPAAGTGPGANGSQWQSELTIHNAAPRTATVAITFHQGTSALGPVEVTLEAKQTVSIADVVRTKFGVTGGTGALVLEVLDRSARSIAVTSRTFNTSTEGEFGQDIPSINVTDAVRAGDIGALTGPSVTESNRFNFGIYAIETTEVTWELVRADGSIATTKASSYEAGQHVQYGSGVASFLAVTPAPNDTVHAHVTSGKAIFYGSAINATGDPTFVPGVRTRDDIVINFDGIDLDENGTVDLRDADADGVLDTPIDVMTSMFGAYFRIVASGEFGESVTYEIVSAPAHTTLLDSQGTMRVIAAGDLKNTTGEIVVKVLSGDSSTLVTIPVSFR